MKRFVCISAFLLAVLFTGESLICNTCTMGFAGRCLFSSTTTCNDTGSSCYWGKVAFNVSKWMTLEAQGCMASDLCNTTKSGSLMSASYTITKTCCSTDLCNAATSIHLSVPAALGVALIAMWSAR